LPTRGHCDAPSVAHEGFAWHEQIVEWGYSDEWSLYACAITTADPLCGDEVYGDAGRRKVLVESGGGQELDREEAVGVEFDDGQTGAGGAAR
jgi:hypothetical protein